MLGNLKDWRVRNRSYSLGGNSTSRIPQRLFLTNFLAKSYGKEKELNKDYSL